MRYTLSNEVQKMLEIKPASGEQFKETLPLFKEKSEEFFTGKMNMKEYKGFSGKYGTYAQRGGKNSMLRLRMNAGRLTPEKLQFVVDMAEKYDVKPVHFTTCQTVQFHNLELEPLWDIMDKALDANVIWYGGGGDYPRNVMCSPLSGVEEEYFDVTPYADAIANFLIDFIDQEKMPRKLKVAFSNSEANRTHATFRDLGFIANANGKFDVYACGGLGVEPLLGVEVAKDVNPDQILYYVEAMIRMFRKYGNYENRRKARTRFLQETLGKEGIQKAFQEELDAVKAEKDLTFQVHIPEVNKEPDGEPLEKSYLVRPQKQEGLYSVHFHPKGGNVSWQTLKALSQAFKTMPQVEMRLEPNEGSFIINLTANEARKILEIIDEEAAHNSFEASTSCIGATICQVGLRDSQGMLDQILKAVKEAGDIADDALPAIFVSGCPSSCGTHQVAPIGLRGAVKVVDRKPIAGFALFVGGSDRQGHEKMGEELGVIALDRLPEFFVDLGRQISASNLPFEEWVKANPQGILEIATPYFVDFVG